MFVWQPNEGNVSDDLGEYWEHIVKHLKSPVRHSLQSFILQTDHDIIRVFREALKGPPGRQTVRSVFLEPDFWQSANSNLPHNKNVRQKLGVQDTTRFTTNWEGFGKKQIPPHYWLEYLRCNFARQSDLLDILSASSMRDAECHDSSFSSFYWNISQNASKEKHRTAHPGIAGCITPGGDFFLPSEGRPILGSEKLMIQGIPYFRLALGNETEVQLGDLAGNAFSLSVSCATILAAITCKELRRLTLASSHNDAARILAENAALDGYKTLSTWTNRTPEAPVTSPTDTSANSLFCELAALAPAAVKSSIFCTCETSGSNSLTCEFLQCKVCRVSCCRNCICTTSGYNLRSHDTADIHLSVEEHSLGNFQSTLRHVAPPTLVFSAKGIEQLANLTRDEYRVAGLSAYKFRLHRIQRDRRKWHVIYYARDSNGLGEAVAEFRITVGELKTEETASFEGKAVDLGMKGELTSFFPAKTLPFKYGKLDPCAVVTCGLTNQQVRWEGRNMDETTSISLKGKGVTDSFRVEVGLTDEAADTLQHICGKPFYTKHFQAAKRRGELRRWQYPENWREWPETIQVGSNAPTQRLAAMLGRYTRAKCRQTTNQSALWIKKGDEKNPFSVYILIKPHVNRTGPDRAVISSSICHDDSSSILAVLPWTWQPCDSLKKGTHAVYNVQLRHWTPLHLMECLLPPSTIKVDSPHDSDNLFTVGGLSEAEVALLCRGKDFREDEVKLRVVGGQEAQKTLRAFNSFCVAPILKHAAGFGLKYDFKPDSPWIPIEPSDASLPFGCCHVTVPRRPNEAWTFDEGRQAWERLSKPGAARKYYLAVSARVLSLLSEMASILVLTYVEISTQLQEAPQPFEFFVNRSSRTLTVKCFPEVIAHRAAGQLIEGRGVDNLQHDASVSFRLSDITQQRDPVVAPFKVSNCDSEKPTFVELKGPHELYERQKKVVTKILAVENSEKTFEEVEMSEHEMPGCGFSLIAKATRKRESTCSFGLLCDSPRKLIYLPEISSMYLSCSLRFCHCRRYRVG